MLKEMIGQTLFAVGENESRPVHAGILFEVEGDTLTMVALDGFRLALRREQILEKHGPDSFSFVVHGKALSEVEKFCSGTDPVTVIQGSRHIMFRTSDTLLVSRKLEGEFLAYQKAIPRNNTIRLNVDSKSMLSCIERVSLIIDDRQKTPLRCVLRNNMIHMSAKTTIGDAQDQCSVQGDGGDMEIGFNHKFLMDALRAAPADRLVMEFSSPVAPCVIVPSEGDEKFIYMVLPVRLKAR